MAKDPDSTRGKAQTIPSSASISSLLFRLFFFKKSPTPHPPYPVEPIFYTENSRNNLHINRLHFMTIYQSVTANRPFCPFLAPKIRSFRPKYSLFNHFSRPLSTRLARTQTLFQRDIFSGIRYDGLFWIC
ncbi:MAG: hypothetical protein ABR907_10575 [Terracidiphilus sp.]|jgi:hypothetical protein